MMTSTPEQEAAAAAHELRPDCDWDGWTKHPCHRKASFRWGTRYICANHAAGWLRQGKTMERMPGIQNPYAGSWLWEQTT
jgi:hypothetical protein